MQPCNICGNNIDFRTVCCPYCGCDQGGEKQNQLRPLKSEFYQKTVNLEQGLPTVEQALQRLQHQITCARLEHISVLTFIHGYGSSGKGGSIRIECRKTLEYLLSQGAIAEVVPGENFNRRLGSIKQLLHRFPELSRHPHLNNKNKGITLVVLS